MRKPTRIGPIAFAWWTWHEWAFRDGGLYYFFTPLSGTAASRVRVLDFGEPGPTLLVGRTITSAPGNPGMPPRTRSRLFSASTFTTVRLRMVMRSLPYRPARLRPFFGR